MKKQTKVKISTAFGLLGVFVLLALFLFSGENFELLKLLFQKEHTNEQLQETLSRLGIKGYITIAVLSMLQVVFTFLPAEPVQVLGGLSFGFPIGLLCCTVGVFLGNSIVFFLYRVFGDRFRDYFIKNLRLDLDRAARSARVTLVILILYFLPAIPYGMICFFAASIGMKYPRFITITVIGSIPSICIGVALGHMTVATSLLFSVIVFAIIIAILIVVLLKKDVLFEKVNAFVDRPPYSSKTVVKSYPAFFLSVAYVISRIVFFLRGVRVRYTKKCGKRIEGAAIVLCTHGSFIDFAYAGTLIRKRSPNFVVARLYFYKKWVGKLLRNFGCFPKSMFAADLESAKNCMRVLREGGVLAMMPEARLSTVGKFEDIQEGTYAFLQKMKVPVYSIRISGDYFASPKWGDGLRRGSLVEAELDILFTAEDLQSLSLDEIRARTLERMTYDEFEWLKTRPNIRYRKRTLAEGLENILSTCPKCKGKYTIKTKGHAIFCEHCGQLASLTDRYGLLGDLPFKDFADWYDWQRGELLHQIEKTPDFALSAKVELRMSALDGKSFLRHVGNGTARLDATGLTYEGEKDGENTTLHFPLEQIYRLLFGAGEDFELYVGQEIYYFVPEERRSAVDFYLASALLVDARAKALIS